MPNKPSLAGRLGYVEAAGIFAGLDRRATAAHGRDPFPKKKKRPPLLRVVQDRVSVSTKNRARLAEAIESALRHGQGEVQVFDSPSTSVVAVDRRATVQSEPE